MPCRSISHPTMIASAGCICRFAAILLNILDRSTEWGDEVAGEKKRIKMVGIKINIKQKKHERIHILYKLKKRQK